MIRHSLKITMHFKCRAGFYPRSNIERDIVPDDKVSWDTEFIQYSPPNYTSSTIEGKPWADPDIANTDFTPKWNHLDGHINRKSHTGDYKVLNGCPLNPVGRTGITGRGVLGRWGPNHAADSVVTRFKLDHSNRQILQFIAIKRGDTGEWALPGGMVDLGEKVAATAIREFQEEALNALEASEAEKHNLKEIFKDFFSNGVEIYSGYVDDPRNTDNAWMETVAYNFHDNDGSTVGEFQLNAGDDAVGVCWVDITPHIKLYASHKDIVDAVYARHVKSL